VLNVTVNLVRLIAVLCEPYMPATARRIVAQLNLPDLGPLPDRFELTLQAGHRIGTPEVLVRKIEDKEIEALKARFGYQPLRLSVYSLFFFFFLFCPSNSLACPHCVRQFCAEGDVPTRYPSGPDS
jgi:hypothetical protein